jgi:hypothetical protein
MAGKSLSKPATKKRIEQPVASSAAAASPAPVAAAGATNEQIVRTKNEHFGLEHQEATKLNDDQISAIVKSVKKAPYGELIIELENGQQWRQVGSDSLRLKEQDVVVIERGVFNSFLLKIEGQNRSIRVKRTN